jgi:alkylated DNA repair dioxygenase AlkB
MGLQAGQAGLRIYPGHLDRGAQTGLLAALDATLAAAPLYVPRMPKSGRPFTVRMSNCGRLGWISDASGKRPPLATHPGEPACAVGRGRRLSARTRGLPHQLLRTDGENGLASGSR